MPAKDPYEILGVARTASADELKRAYRRLAREYHPDRNQGDKQAEQKFKEVQAAWEVLSDPERRRQYDQYGAGGPTPDYSHWTRNAGHGDPQVRVDFSGFQGGFDISDIIEQFFGGRGRRARTAGPGATRSAPAARGANIEHQVYLSLEEAASGARREVLIQDQQGQTERIDFRVPPGVADGQRVRIAGKGHHGAGGRGDLLVTCHVQPHPRFRREGDSLVTDATISFRDAALGARIDVPTLDGVIHMNVPPGTQGGARLRARGMGMPTRDGGRGDLFVTIRISVPLRLSTRSQELIEALDEELKSSAAEPTT